MGDDISIIPYLDRRITRCQLYIWNWYQGKRDLTKIFAISGRKKTKSKKLSRSEKLFFWSTKPYVFPEVLPGSISYSNYCGSTVPLTVFNWRLNVPVMFLKVQILLFFTQPNELVGKKNWGENRGTKTGGKRTASTKSIGRNSWRKDILMAKAKNRPIFSIHVLVGLSSLLFWKLFRELENFGYNS